MTQARLRRKLRRTPNDSLTWSRLAALCLDEGDVEAARIAAETAAGCAGDGEQVIAASDLLHRAGHTDLALDGYKFAAQLSPDSADGHAALGRFALRFNRLEQACKAFSRASDLAPQDTELRRLLGRALFANQKATLAARVFEALWTDNPDDVGLAFELAEAASAAGEGKLAMRSIRMAAQAAPDRLDIRLRLSACVARHETVEASVILLEGLRADWPQSPEVLLNMASAQAELGNVDAALAYLDEAHELRPDQPIIERNRGAILFGAVRYEAAADSFAALTLRMPENADAHLLLAIVMHRLHRMDAARANAHRAIALAGESQVRLQARRFLDALTAPCVVAAEQFTGPVDGEEIILSGALERVPVTQVLEFARTNNTTGRLLLSARDGVADVRLDNGYLVSASCSETDNLIDRIVRHEWAKRPQIGEWIEHNRGENHDRPLGALMVSTGLVTQTQLDSIIKEQIFSVITAIVQWSKGSFRLIDATHEGGPGNVVLPTDGVLLHVMWQLDEVRADS
ncbi:MAG: putative Zn-dependent protease [Bradymonadia bacterium]|jgi:predicted Zn-dependent protease